jgi:PadR family transcriptional regulator PadR
MIYFFYLCLRNNFNAMKGQNLGEFEELVLLAVGALFEKAYGISVMDEIKDKTGRSANISAIHTVLKRMEDKGYVTSHMGGATNVRGGRRKRYFLLTSTGRSALENARDMRMQFYERIPALSFSQ